MSASERRLGHERLLWVIRVDSTMPVTCPVSGSFRKYWLVVDGVALVVFRAPKLEPRIMRCDRSD